VVAPHALASLGMDGRSGLLAGWIFGLISLYDGASIASVVPLDAWGQTVLRRVTRAAWIISALLIALHVVMWSSSYSLSLLPTILGLPFLAIPRLRQELNVWLVVVGTLTVTLFVAPSVFWITAILASGALCLRVVAPKRSPVAIYPTPQDSRHAPYRTNGPTRNERENGPISVIMPELTEGERLRCWSGALFSLYLGLWTMSWNHGVVAHHLLVIDVAFTLVAGIAAWRSRARVTFLVPLAATYIHLIAQERLIPFPTSEASLGEAAIAFGFALLGGALLVSYKLRSFEITRP
ncbi:MAG: hypothetical protein ABI183_11925, partial [Polyangiaceae bacterium]